MFTCFIADIVIVKIVTIKTLFNYSHFYISDNFEFQQNLQQFVFPVRQAFLEIRGEHLVK